MKSEPYLTMYTIFNLKLIKNLNIRLETVKFLEENTGRKLFDIGLGSDFSGMTLKAQATRDTWYYIMITSLKTSAQ